MPTYVYECPEHGRTEITKPMARAGREEFCPACCAGAERRHAVLPPPMRRIYSAPVVQNLSASAGTLQSFGRDLRVERAAKSLGQLVREKERSRHESRAAALGEET